MKQKKQRFAENSKLAAEAKKIADEELKEMYALIKRVADEPAAEPTVSKPKKFDVAAQRAAFRADLNK